MGVEYEVEFWPQKVVKVLADSETEALEIAVAERGWQGGSECQTYGQCFKAWVREVRNDPAP